jgi:hypothetical protein
MHGKLNMAQIEVRQVALAILSTQVAIEKQLETNKNT